MDVHNFEEESYMRVKALTVCILALINVLGFVYASDQTRSNIHQVQKGESLSSLAQLYLGSSTRWREIWAANPLVRNPDQIKVGTEILIPSTPQMSINHHLNLHLEMYRPAALDLINSGSIDRFNDHRVLFHQNALTQQLHVSAIDQSTHTINIVASSNHQQQTTNYLIIRENQRHRSTSGEVVDARILGHASSSHTDNLITLTVNHLFQPLISTEMSVIPDQRSHVSSGNIQIHSPIVPPAAKIIQVLYNEPNGLFTVIHNGANQVMQPGGIVRYRNPGTSTHSYDGVLLIVNGINGASYAAVISSIAPPMPTASVF